MHYSQKGNKQFYQKERVRIENRENDSIVVGYQGIGKMGVENLEKNLIIKMQMLF